MVHQSFTWSGFMKDNVPQGAGVATYSNGDKFEGTYENSKRSGRGKYTFKNGASYDGMYQDGVKSGFGVMKYPDKSSYEGKSTDHGHEMPARQSLIGMSPAAQFFWRLDSGLCDVT